MHKCLSSQHGLSGGCNSATTEKDERDHPGDGLHQEGEARNKTSSPISPTEVDEGTRSLPERAMGEGRQNPPMHVQGRPEWVRARETTPRSLPPSKPEGVWRTKKRRRPWKRQRSVERDLTRPSPCLARRMRIQLKAHTRQTWSQIERRADADIDIINLSRRIRSPSELKVLGRGLSFVPKPKRIQQERFLTEFVRKMRLRYLYRDHGCAR